MGLGPLRTTKLKWPLTMMYLSRLQPAYGLRPGGIVTAGVPCPGDRPCDRARLVLLRARKKEPSAIKARAATPPTTPPTTAPTDVLPDGAWEFSRVDAVAVDFALFVALGCTTLLTSPQASADFSSMTDTRLLDVVAFACHSVKLLESWLTMR